MVLGSHTIHGRLRGMYVLKYSYVYRHAEWVECIACLASRGKNPQEK